jgi:hypothetical protein
LWAIQLKHWKRGSTIYPLPRLFNLGCGFDHRAGWLALYGWL